MKNNDVCKTVGIGNICVRMFDGQGRPLTNVRYILNLKKIFSHWELWKFEGTSLLVQMKEPKLLKAP